MVATQQATPYYTVLFVSNFLSNLEIKKIYIYIVILNQIKVFTSNVFVEF